MQPQNQPRQARRLISEFLVIVVGVFVALAAESWWSEREDRRIEQELRQDMVAEFASNLRILESDLATNVDAIATLRPMLDLPEADYLLLPDDAINEVLGPFINWAGFDPEMGSAQALVESGNVGIIGDRKLRLLMSRWTGLLDGKERFNAQGVTYQLQTLEPFTAHAMADLRWSEEERRELRAHLRNFVSYMGIVMSNQRELQVTASEIHQYLTAP